MFDTLRLISTQPSHIALYTSFVLLVHLSLHLVLPASLLLLYSHWISPSLLMTESSHQQATWISTVLWMYSIAEVIFCLRFFCIIAPKMQQHSAPPNLSKQEREELISQILTHIKDGEQFISRWFMDAEINEIGTENVAEWVVFAFWGCQLEKLRDDERVEVAAIVERILFHLNLKHIIKNGRNPNVKFMAHVLDPVRFIYRPLLYYIITAYLLGGLTVIGLYLLGFRRHNDNDRDVIFWVRQPSSSSRLGHDGSTSCAGLLRVQKPPIVFFHGLGIGLLVYLPFFATLINQNSKNRTLIVASMPSISTRLPSVRHVPSRGRLIESVGSLLFQLGHEKAVFMGHSFGSAAVSWLVKLAPHLVARAALIDPIIFQLSEPDVVCNFLYRQPKSFEQLVMKWFASHEPGIAYVISRHFWWTQNILFGNDVQTFAERSQNESEFISSLPNSTSSARYLMVKSSNRTSVPSKSPAAVIQHPPIWVFLSEHDCIIDSGRVREFLENHSIEYHEAKGLNHGSFIWHPSCWEVIANISSGNMIRVEK